MHVPINVKSPNNISKWQKGFNSAFKGLIGKMGLSEICCEYGRWIELGQDRVQWHALVLAVLQLCVLLPES